MPAPALSECCERTTISGFPSPSRSATAGVASSLASSIATSPDAGFGGSATVTGQPGTSVPSACQACSRPSQPACTISRPGFPSRSTSTGEAVAPWCGSRVYGSAGRGIAGLVTPAFSVFGQPGRSRPWASKAYVRPVVLVATTSRFPSWARSPTATGAMIGSCPKSTPGIRCGSAFVVAGQPGSSAPLTPSMACTRPSASPKTIASCPVPCRSARAGWLSPPMPNFSGKPARRPGSWCTAIARRSSPMRPWSSHTRRRMVTVYCSVDDSALSPGIGYALVQNELGSLVRSSVPSLPSYAPLPVPEPAETKSESDGSIPGANCTSYRKLLARRASTCPVTGTDEVCRGS